MSKEWHTVGIFLSSSGSRSYRSLSPGSPGWILFWIPSIPASNMEAKAKYGLAVASGKRPPERRPLGLEIQGIRMDAEGLRAEYASFTGASKPGTRRL